MGVIGDYLRPHHVGVDENWDWQSTDFSRGGVSVDELIAGPCLSAAITLEDVCDIISDVGNLVLLR